MLTSRLKNDLKIFPDVGQRKKVFFIKTFFAWKMHSFMFSASVSGYFYLLSGQSKATCVQSVSIWTAIKSQKSFISFSAIILLLLLLSSYQNTMCLYFQQFLLDKIFVKTTFGKRQKSLNLDWVFVWSCNFLHEMLCQPYPQ